MIRVAHYINQFFAGIGGEDKADYKPELREGFAGPGLGLNSAFGDKAEIVGTVVCGDTYFNENIEEACKTVVEMVKSLNVDLFVAGPAFNAGRYGVACGAVCQAVKKELNIPVVTAMYEENPGVEMYKKDALILKTANAATGMRKDLPRLAALALKVGSGEELESPEKEGTIPQGIRKNFFKDARGSHRAVDFLVKKLKGEEFETEFPMPVFDRVAPQPAVKDITKAKVAVLTSGGIVPKGNPDHIESSSASHYGRYEITGIKDLTSETHETAHGGYDPTYANEDADRVLPVDVLREMEEKGEIGSLYNYFYTTTGNGTAVASAKKWGAEIVQDFVNDGVQAVILTST